MQLRRLGAEDAAEFWALRLRAFREEPESFGSTYEENAGRPLADVARQLEDTVVVGAYDPELVGIAGLLRESRAKRRHRVTLWGMYVAPEGRGRGLGRKLVEELVRRAREMEGVQQILLTVMAGNGSAIGLYEALGFRAYGHAPRAMLMDGKAFDEELMLLEL